MRAPRALLPVVITDATDFCWLAWIDGEEERNTASGPTKAHAIEALIFSVEESL